jgi:hypothetical protein
MVGYIIFSLWIAFVLSFIEYSAFQYISWKSVAVNIIKGLLFPVLLLYIIIEVLNEKD